MKKISYNALDLLKFFLAFLVIAIHVKLNEENPLLKSICSLAVPLFFVINGFFLSKKISTSGNEPLKITIKKTFRIWLTWIIIYLPYSVYGAIEDGKGLIREIVISTRMILFSGSCFYSWQLWYLHALFIAVFLFYILRRLKINTLGIVIISFLLYIIGQNMTLIHSNEVTDSPFINLYFSLHNSVRNGIFFAPGFISLGFIINEYRSILDKYKRFLICTIPIIGVCHYYKIPFATHLLVLLIIYCIVSKDLKDSPIWIWFRKMSMMIFYSHMLIVGGLHIAHCDMDILPLYGTACILTTILSAILVYSMSFEKLSFLKRLIS